MKCRQILSLIFVTFLLCFTVVGCATKQEFKDITELYTVTKNKDNTYSYSLADLKGNILFEKENVVREPKINAVSTNVYELITQTGTGLSTNWAVYCDVEKGMTSEVFQYVLMAQGDYVIYANYENSKHSVIVQNIFDKSYYYKKHILANCSPIAGDVVIKAESKGEGSAVVTYLTGNDYKEAELAINFP